MKPLTSRNSALCVCVYVAFGVLGFFRVCRVWVCVPGPVGPKEQPTAEKRR